MAQTQDNKLQMLLDKQDIENYSISELVEYKKQLAVIQATVTKQLEKKINIEVTIEVQLALEEWVKEWVKEHKSYESLHLKSVQREILYTGGYGNFCCDNAEGRCNFKLMFENCKLDLILFRNSFVSDGNVFECDYLEITMADGSKIFNIKNHQELLPFLEKLWQICFHTIPIDSVAKELREEDFPSYDLC